jgi:hypothetical protein
LSKSGHRFRQQVVRFSLGGMRLVAQPPIGSPMHAARLLRKRLQRVVAPAEPHLDHLRSAPCASYGNLPLARVAQPQASPTGEVRPVKLCNAPATNLTVDSGQAFEPRPAAAEVAFCPHDRDLQLDDPRLSGAGRASAVDQYDGVRLGEDEDLLRGCTDRSTACGRQPGEQKRVHDCGLASAEYLLRSSEGKFSSLSLDFRVVVAAQIRSAAIYAKAGS